jgi:hypothetical protein
MKSPALASKLIVSKIPSHNRPKLITANRSHEEVKFDLIYRRWHLITTCIKNHTSLKVTPITIPEIIAFTSFTNSVRIATGPC